MRIATWNVNGLRARLDVVLRWLRSRRPDIVGLQEIKATDEQFPRAEIEAEGYRAAVYGQKSWNGVAILSREPVEVTERGLPGQEGMGARLLSADLGGLSFTTVYVPNGKDVAHEDFPRKLAWLDTLAARLRAREDPARAAVVCGDFNICPSPLDSWSEDLLRGSIFHTDEERERYRRLLEGGFHDLFRERHPDVQAYTWWDYRAGAFPRGQGLRIDMLLGTPAVLRRLRSVEIDREFRKKQDGLTPSDHAPVYADLE